MTYEEFIEGYKEYLKIVDSGLKKQANKFLFGFVEEFGKLVPKGEADDILFRFCREYFDEEIFRDDKNYPLRLPFQLSGLLFEYLSRECGMNKMPQLRWKYELFGWYYDPFEPNTDPVDPLERAYEHPERDLKTAVLYFNEQMHILEFGAHHFPDGCCIEKTAYEKAVFAAEKILSENELPRDTANTSARELEFFKRLYELYYRWSENGRQGDFAELCRKNDLDFSPTAAYYYK